jgi:hypothetical protein
MSRYIDLEQIEFLKVDGNEEFNHGVDCCINRLLKAEPIKAVSLDKVKQAREEMSQKSHADADGWDTVIDLDDALEILDKLIESEE